MKRGRIDWGNWGGIDKLYHAVIGAGLAALVTIINKPISFDFAGWQITVQPWFLAALSVLGAGLFKETLDYFKGKTATISDIVYTVAPGFAVIGLWVWLG